MSDRWFIYGLRAPEDERIAYVGFSRNPATRLRQHVSTARTGGQLPVHAWIRTIGVDPAMQILEVGSGPKWKSAECGWIARFGIDNLLNVSLGGNQPAVPQASRDRAREKLRGRVFTPEWRAKIAAAKTGKKRPDNAARCRVMAQNNRGRPMTLSDAERARRRDSLISLGDWRDRPDAAEIRDRISAKASEQMKRVWASRRSARGD